MQSKERCWKTKGRYIQQIGRANGETKWSNRTNAKTNIRYIQKENKELKHKLVINNTVNNTKNKNCNNTQINNNIQLVAFPL